MTEGTTIPSINKIIIMVENIFLDFLLLKKFIFSPLLFYERSLVTMKIPSFLIIVFIFILWLQYELRKSKRLSSKSNEEFWALENKSNLVRKSDISKLNYIQIPAELLSISDYEDSRLKELRDTILKLSEKNILNLTGITNIELKLKYGTANLHLLSEYDNNYTILVRTLNQWGDNLYSKGYVEDAATILEYAVTCQSDVSKTYKTLASIYKEQNKPNQIDELIHHLSNIKMLRKEAVILELNNIKSL